MITEVHLSVTFILLSLVITSSQWEQTLMGRVTILVGSNGVMEHMLTSDKVLVVMFIMPIPTQWGV